MSEFIPTEKGVPIRQPSTANLMVDSQDRPFKDVSGNLAFGPVDFTISKKQSILNGYFTRIGVTEVVLEWFQPNVNTQASNALFGNEFTFTDDTGTYIINIPEGFYNVATLVQEMAKQMQDSSSRGYIASGGNGKAQIDISGAGGFEFGLVQSPNSIVDRLGFVKDVSGTSHFVGEILTNINGLGWTPDLRLYRFIDFISNSLTYNQELKDGTTANSIDNILARWYFAEDTPTATDEYGFPILQGYEPFVRRRLFNPPKQIKWSPQQPLGQIQFQVQYQLPSNQNVPAQLLPYDTRFDFLMTLQVSEV